MMTPSVFNFAFLSSRGPVFPVQKTPPYGARLNIGLNLTMKIEFICDSEPLMIIKVTRFYWCFVHSMARGCAELKRLAHRNTRARAVIPVRPHCAPVSRRRGTESSR
jgi:hypothetical protein